MDRTPPLYSYRSVLQSVSDGSSRLLVPTYRWFPSADMPCGYTLSWPKQPVPRARRHERRHTVGPLIRVDRIVGVAGDQLLVGPVVDLVGGGSHRRPAVTLEFTRRARRPGRHELGRTARTPVDVDRRVGVGGDQACSRVVKTTTLPSVEALDELRLAMPRFHRSRPARRALPRCDWRDAGATVATSVHASMATAAKNRPCLTPRTPKTRRAVSGAATTIVAICDSRPPGV